MPKLYVLCGISGSGKSTWAHNFIKEHPEVHYVSRDEIRFSMVGPDERYFSKENEVLSEFIKTIADNLSHGFDTIADATHLNQWSRGRLLHAIDKQFKQYEIIFVVFIVDYDKVIEHNNLREGRAKVPEHIINEMFQHFTYPSDREDRRVIDIIEIN